MKIQEERNHVEFDWEPERCEVKKENVESIGGLELGFPLLLSFIIKGLSLLHI